MLELMLLLSLASQPGDWDDSNVGEEQQEYEPEQDDYASPAEDAPPPEQRAQEADVNFETIMMKNAAPAPKMPQAAQAPAFDQGMLIPQQPVETKVVIPLRAYGSLRDQLKKEREGSSRATGPAVVLGAS